MNNILTVIPARLAATRLPRKPLADICGKPMVIHVWERALKANLGPVLIACGDPEILEAIQPYGAEGVLTDPTLASGTDRVKAALDLYDPQKKYEHIIGLQGDLPTIDPQLLHLLLEPLKNPTVDIATLATLIVDPDQLTNPNIVKIALTFEDNNLYPKDFENSGRRPSGEPDECSDLHDRGRIPKGNAPETRKAKGITVSRALYFSRACIPYGAGPVYHHIGIYAYHRSALDRFVSLPVHPLEAQEKLEQLRALGNGMRIDVSLADTSHLVGVDTPADLEKARRIIETQG